MKTRNGFVSNSSSSSFVIQKKYLSDYHIYCIWNHITVAKEIERTTGKNVAGYYDPWKITDDGDAIKGYTIMNNFDMFNFLEYIGVDMYRLDRDSDNDDSYYGSFDGGYDE